MSLEDAKRELKHRINSKELAGVESLQERKGKKQLFEMLGGFLATVLDTNNKMQEGMDKSLMDIKVELARKTGEPIVNIPDVNIPEIKLPEIKIPEIKVNVPTIEVPKAEIKVKIPEIIVPDPRS